MAQPAKTYWRAAGILAILLLLPLIGTAAAESYTAAVAALSYLGMNNLPRGMRNNNPGNIRTSATMWQGKIPLSENTDGAFEQFKTYAFGVRAMIKTLQSYARNYGINTLEGIIKRWAPASDNNNTVAYIASVGLQSGLPANTPLDLQNKDTMRRLVQAMTKVENGRDAVDNDVFNYAWDIL